MELALKTEWLKSEPSKEWLNSHQDEDFFIDFKKNYKAQTGATATVQINFFSEKLYLSIKFSVKKLFILNL